MNAYTSDQEVREFQLTRQQAADLLYRYPNVSEAEAKLIIVFLRKGRHLDVGMLIADERLKLYLDRFMGDHARHFRIGLGEAAAVIAMIAGFLVICWLVWEAIKPGSL